MSVPSEPDATATLAASARRDLLHQTQERPAFLVNRRVSFGYPELPPNRLVLGDNLRCMQFLAPGSIALIYADPPFFSGRERRGTTTRRLDPIWFSDVWPDGRDAYLGWLGERLRAMQRLLAPTGSIFVHLDRRAVHYVKVEMDRLFGAARFVNEIVWHYTGGGRSRRRFSHKHDTILWYANGPTWTFNIEAVRQPYKPTSGYARSGITSAAGKRYLPHPAGTPADDVWDIPIVNPLSPERTGYPTQKPEALLERIIAAASRPGEVVADFFCGSGVTPVVAQRLGRRWIACDVAPAAIAITHERLVQQACADAGRSATPVPDFTIEEVTS